MKFVVIGGNGRIGSRVVAKLRARGHEATAASPSSGVDTITGKGVADALEGAHVVIDVSNAPSFANDDALTFFETAARNVHPVERAKGVKHHVALSVVGADRMTGSGYMRAKVAQERAIAGSGVPYTILRATQFFEFMEAIAGGSMVGSEVRLSTAAFQPIAAEDVADAVVDVAIAAPKNGILEVGGPEKAPLDAMVRRLLVAKNDPRPVVGDPNADYFGAALDDATLVPGADPRLGKTTLEAWIAAQVK